MQTGKSMHGSRVGTGGPDAPHTLDSHKAIGFLSNTGPDPRKKRQYSHRPASETPFQWPMKARFNDVWILSPPHN